MIDFNDPKVQHVIDWLETKPVDYLWTMFEIVDGIRVWKLIDLDGSLLEMMQQQKVFTDTYFIKRAYYHLNNEVRNYILASRDPDPIWIEHLMLTERIKEDLYYEPFMVKCDDKDFLIGALETALAEVKEPMWFDWYIEFHSKGDDEGDYWEVKRFEEDI